MTDEEAAEMFRADAIAAGLPPRMTAKLSLALTPRQRGVMITENRVELTGKRRR
jgi:hypothetical protein